MGALSPQGRTTLLTMPAGTSVRPGTSPLSQSDVAVRNALRNSRLQRLSNASGAQSVPPGKLWKTSRPNENSQLSFELLNRSASRRVARAAEGAPFVASEEPCSRKSVAKSRKVLHDFLSGAIESPRPIDLR